MIPRKLDLTNFISYRRTEPALDFTDVHVACLSGPNGNGKSTLLDAITWALWGKARGCEGGHDQERLIRDGADGTRVELEFELEGQIYRVVRERTRKGKGDLHLDVAAGDGWTSLAGESMTATQATISKLLRMEYETFVASAFILQGRADEFSTMGAAERKDTLAKILGLEIYERLAARAKEYKKTHADQADALRKDAELAESTLAELPPTEQALAAAEAAAVEAEKGQEGAREESDRIQARLNELAGIEAEVNALQDQRSQKTADVAAIDAEIARTERELTDASAAALVDDAEHELAGHVLSLEQQDAGLEEARSKDAALESEIAALNQRIAVERQRLTGERLAAAEAGEAARADLATIDAAGPALAQTRSEWKKVEEAKAERELLLQRHRELAEGRAREQAAVSARSDQRAELAERIDRLAGADAECPVCEQPLTAAHRKKIDAEAKARIASFDAADKAARESVRTLEKELEAVERRGLELKRLISSGDAIAGKAASLEQTLARAPAVRAAMASAEARIAEIDAIIAADADSPTERQKLESTIGERVAIGYHTDAHKDVKGRLERARVAERAVAGAAQARVLAGALEKQLVAARKRLTDAQSEMARIDGVLRERAGALREIPDRAQELRAARSAADAFARTVLEHRTSAARARERIDALALVAERAKVSRAEHADARVLSSRYDRLAKAFGRDGIPARIISNAIPEVEHEANLLLALLTDGKLTIKMELLRETKSKTAKDTLDITVFDTAGVRPYEMYSGGERLRIDFALRIALSRLLARRAGTKLETLVVDEGFGSQDADGRVRLVEAILKVKGDFKRILVVTHLDDLKDLFGVRIEVRKDPVSGSTARIL